MNDDKSVLNSNPIVTKGQTVKKGQVVADTNFTNDGVLAMGKNLRVADASRVGMTPFDIEIRTPDGTPIVQITRGISFFLSKVTVRNESGEVIGGFKQKLFTVGGKFDVLDADDQLLCSLKGKWTGWNFLFISGETELTRERARLARHDGRRHRFRC